MDVDSKVPTNTQIDPKKVVEFLNDHIGYALETKPYMDYSLVEYGTDGNVEWIKYLGHIMWCDEMGYEYNYFQAIKSTYEPTHIDAVEDEDAFDEYMYENFEVGVRIDVLVDIITHHIELYHNIFNGITL
jgi:hypothetical protein